MKRQLLIIDKTQFGYLTDSFKWCEYLRTRYEITYLCYDLSLPKQVIKGVNVKYFPLHRKGIIRNLRWLFVCITAILLNRGMTIVIYHTGADLLKRLLPWKKMILDIRTLSVAKQESERNLSDEKVRRTARKYNAVTIISEGLSAKLGEIGREKFVLPLGSDAISNSSKSYNLIKLLYVGTFSGRHLEDTLYGLKAFVTQNPDCELTYDIVGSGYKDELEDLSDLAKSLGLQNSVTFHGRLPHHEIKRFFDDCNIGVCYVPITEYYEYQPPTKLFEYVLSGLYVIATATGVAKKLIRPQNGILIQDSPESFCCALQMLLERLNNISEMEIRQSLKEHTWAKIVESVLEPWLAKWYHH